MGSDQLPVTVLRSIRVLPGHEDAYCAVWQQEARVMKRHGFTVLNAFVETGPGIIYRPAAGQALATGDERVFTWTYSYVGDIDAAEGRLRNDSEVRFLSQEASKHVVDEGTTRRVRPEPMVPTNAGTGGMVIMRQYQIVGDWNEFLHIWRRIVPLRDQHGFPCLFAVGDLEASALTWAFSYGGDSFEEFLGPGQAAYYNDPQRVELETVNAYLEQVRLTPARELAIS